MRYDWRGRQVAITGGAGFLGSNLAARLVREGASVRIADNLERGRIDFLSPLGNAVDFRQLDMRRPDDAERAVEGADVVFHLAAKVGGIGVYLGQPGEILTNNLLIDQNVIAAVITRRVPSFFYASSAHVYPEALQGRPDAPALSEDDAYPAQPGLTYGWAKLMGEQAVLGWAREKEWLRVAIARIVGAYGYNQDIALETGSVIPVFCHRAARWPEGAPFRIWGTGEETRSYCFVDDIVEGFLRSIAAQQENRIVGPFNLGNEGRATIRQIAELVVDISGKAIPLSFDTGARTTLWGQAVDGSLAGRLLAGWRPTHDLATGVRLTYEQVRARLEKGC